MQQKFASQAPEEKSDLWDERDDNETPSRANLTERRPYV